ncbi:hypothetical protein glysoja_022357 [Glycine soja]|nr:hypothetical protein glysoja_022357 [Glycine soja]
MTSSIILKCSLKHPCGEENTETHFSLCRQAFNGFSAQPVTHEGCKANSNSLFQNIREKDKYKHSINVVISIHTMTLTRSEGHNTPQRGSPHNKCQPNSVKYTQTYSI